MAPCRELQMAKRYLKTIVSRLKTSNPNTHVSPRRSGSAAEPLRPALQDEALRKTRKTITVLI